jgi:hypothetical protein
LRQSLFDAVQNRCAALQAANPHAHSGGFKVSPSVCVQGGIGWAATSLASALQYIPLPQEAGGKTADAPQAHAFSFGAEPSVLAQAQHVVLSISVAHVSFSHISVAALATRPLRRPSALQNPSGSVMDAQGLQMSPASDGVVGLFAPVDMNQAAPHSGLSYVIYSNMSRKVVTEETSHAASGWRNGVLANAKVRSRTRETSHIPTG